MYLKLPIINNKNLEYSLFTLKYENNEIILDKVNKNIFDLYYFLSGSKEFCLIKTPIKFPLKFQIYENKYLICRFFYQIANINNVNDLDFFSNILDKIKSFNKNFSYIDINYLIKNWDNLESYLDVNSKKKHENFEELQIYIDEKINYNLNKIYFWFNNPKLYEKYCIEKKINKKIISSINLIKQEKINLKGMIFNVKDHLEKINNIIELNPKVGKNYFFKNNNKVIKLELTYVDDIYFYYYNKKMLKSECTVYIYNPLFKDIINLDFLTKTLINYNFKWIKIIGYKILNKDKKQINNFLEYLYFNKYNIYLVSLINLNYQFNNLEQDIKKFIESEELELEVLKQDIISYEFLNYLIRKYKDDDKMKLKILKILFDNYTFPLSYNKKKLNPTFEMILYLSCYFIKDIIKIINNKIFLNSEIDFIPGKVKFLYFNLIKVYYQYLVNSFENISFNFKFYQDYIYIYSIKNILQDNTILTELFVDKERFNQLIKIYQTNIILIQIIDTMKWSNLYKKLDYLDFVYKNNDLVFFQNKLNKNLIGDNFDYKLKGILLDKFYMYKYLKHMKDYIKWTRFIKNYIIDFYENPISLSENDLDKLGKLIYKLINLESQNIRDKKYQELITFCQKNKKLILINNRINLKIKEKIPFLKFNFNLGHFAKHVNHNQIPKLEIDDNTEVEKLQDEIIKIKKKYYKYKGKYLKTKKDFDNYKNKLE